MREVFIRRPLILAALGLVLGIVAAAHWVAALLLFVLLLLVRELRAAAICAVAFTFGVLLAPPVISPLLSKQWLDAEVRVSSVPRPYPTETVAEIEVKGEKLMMSGPPNLHIELGQEIHIRGRVQPLDEGSNRLADRGIRGRIWVNGVTATRPAPWIDHVGQHWRDSFIAFADRSLPPRAAAAVEAVCFNVQSKLDPSDREEFSRAGTVHVISASGLHVGILVILLLGLMSLLPIPRSASLIIVGVVLLFYAIASGLHPPVIRAAMMAAVLSVAYLARREPDLLSAISLAAIAQMIWDSTAIYDAGFQLTFVVLAAVALFSYRTRPVAKAARNTFVEHAKFYISRAALVTVVAAPLIAYDFGAVSLPSVVANALTVIVLPPLVVAAMAAHLISFLSASIAAGLMAVVVQPLSGWLLFVTDHFGGDWASLTVPAFSGYWVLLAYGLMLLVWRLRLRPA
jgi:ComEC/Rec2-related protein